MKAPFRIGTRGSPLALAQTEEFCRRLAAASGRAPDAFEIVTIKTRGDASQESGVSLSLVGGKGLFTRELDEAMQEGRIDAAVHSTKDLPTAPSEGVTIVGFLPREDPRDCLCSSRYGRLSELPHGSRLGTSSLRRQALIKRLRPDLEIGIIRGNVGTRLKRVEEGVFDATILALAGLRRLGLGEHAKEILDAETFVPSAGQGAIAVTAREGDAAAAALIQPILDAETGVAVTAERAFLGALDGSCRTPIGAHAKLEGASVRLHGIVLSVDGREAFEERETAAAGEGEDMGRRLGEALLKKLPTGFF
jgi:hydroxymethylbilane synthase